MDNKLSPHFSFDELTFSEAALRHSINNLPGPIELNNLKFLARKLEEVRALLNKPMHINSAYRSQAVNALIGSKPTSAHVRGLAADFVCPEFGTPEQIVLAVIGSDIQYDQVILEFGRWVHIGFAPTPVKPRLQKLVIDAQGTRNFV